jgi:hypothetical protein
MLIPDEDMQLMVECSDSDLSSSVDSKTDSDHCCDMLLNDDGNDNEAEVASFESFVWENVRL